MITSFFNYETLPEKNNKKNVDKKHPKVEKLDSIEQDFDSQFDSENLAVVEIHSDVEEIFEIIEINDNNNDEELIKPKRHHHHHRHHQKFIKQEVSLIKNENTSEHDESNNLLQSMDNENSENVQTDMLVEKPVEPEMVLDPNALEIQKLRLKNEETQHMLLQMVEDKSTQNNLNLRLYFPLQSIGTLISDRFVYANLIIDDVKVVGEYEPKLKKKFWINQHHKFIFDKKIHYLNLHFGEYFLMSTTLENEFKIIDDKDPYMIFNIENENKLNVELKKIPIAPYKPSYSNIFLAFTSNAWNFNFGLEDGNYITLIQIIN